MTQSNEELDDVMAKLNLLAPGKADMAQATPQAFAQVQRQIKAQKTSIFQQFLMRWNNMNNRKPFAIGITVFLFFIISFSFPAVRAAASDFLGLFRVQKFAAISISPEQIGILEQIAEEGLSPGEFTVNHEPGEATAVSSLEEAAAATELALRTLPELGQPAEINLIDGGDGILTVDLAGSRAIVGAAGADPMLLPDSLDGARVEVLVFDSVEQSWENGVHLIQAESPLVQYPDDVNPTVLGEALLQVLGVDAAEAHRLAQSIDWTSTLLLPIPQEAAAYNEISVNGVSGIAINSLQSSESSLMWQKDGIIYVMGGELSTDELVKLANTIQ